MDRERIEFPVETVVTIVDYTQESYQEWIAHSLEQCMTPRLPSSVRWIDVQGTLSASVVEAVGSLVDLHPLVIEDISSQQRPKLDDYHHYLFIVCNVLSSRPSEGIVRDQLSLVLAQDTLLSFHSTPLPPIRHRRDRLRGSLGHARRGRADHLVYSILDSAMDLMRSIAQEQQDALEDLEEELTMLSASQSIEQIIDAKRDVLLLLQTILPTCDVIAQLQRGSLQHFNKETRVYFRDLHDHGLQVLDSAKSCRDLISSMMMIYSGLLTNLPYQCV